MRAVLLFVVLTVASGAALADFTGRVVKISDGDTLTVLVNKAQIRVRLDGIDAPEAQAGVRPTLKAIPRRYLRRQDR